MNIFDLESALDGADVCTRSGLCVSQLRTFSDDEESLIGVIHTSGGRSILGRWNTDGLSVAKESLDLFMEPTQEELFINLYKKDGVIKSGKVHTSRTEALNAANSSPMYFGTLAFDPNEIDALS
jgi:hypothetical protein